MTSSKGVAPESTSSGSISIPQVQPWLGAEERSAVDGVLATGWLTEGPHSRALSKKLTATFNVPHGVFAPNGTLALALGLLALDIGPGDEVLVPNITFAGSATAILLVGATPVFVEVLPQSYQIDAEDARRRVTPATRAIMPVHLYGSACDLDAIGALAGAFSLAIIEDAAQGVGVLFNGTHVGSQSDISCFSFFADKTITMGEGGFVACRDSQIYERLLLLRNQGRIDRGSFVHPEIGFNFRITDVQAAIGLAQLEKLDKIISRKQTIFSQYKHRLDDVPEIQFLEHDVRSTNVPFRIVIFCQQREALSAWLERAGIQCRSFFYPLHRQPCFKHLPSSQLSYPVSDIGFDTGLCLPVFPTLTERDVSYICNAIREFFERSR